jgi:hypothetical protein
LVQFLAAVTNLLIDAGRERPGMFAAKRLRRTYCCSSISRCIACYKRRIEAAGQQFSTDVNSI